MNIETWDDAFRELGATLGIHPRVLERMFKAARETHPDDEEAQVSMVHKGMMKAARAALAGKGDEDG